MSITNAFDRIRREAGIKRCIIVDGNVNDVYLIGRELYDIKGALRSILNSGGFDDIILWDRVTGIQGDVQALKFTDDEEQKEGDEYDLGDITIPQNTGAGSCKDLGDIFSLIHRNMSDCERHAAFVLDWSEYLFSTGGTT